ncbi:MAG: tetratricopeptide repeat protein [Bdellovibrionota bacterium]
MKKVNLLAVTAILFTSCQTTTIVQKRNSQKNHLHLGNQYAKDGLLREAITSYKMAIQEDPQNLTARRNIGLVLVKIGNYKHAINNLELAVKKFDSDFDINFYLGEAYRGNGNYADAIFWYKKATKLKPNSDKTLKALAWSYFNTRFYSQALKISRKLYKLSPKDPEAALIISRTFIKLKRPGDAFKVLKLAKQRASAADMAFLQSIEGDILFELGKCDKAINSYKNAIKDKPLLASALLGLGRCYMKEGENTRAITFLERAARIRPRMAEIFYNLGLAYENINSKKAIRYYQTFNRLASTDPEFLSLLKEVRDKTITLKNQTNLK